MLYNLVTMKNYLVCYDIGDDRERRRVARCLEYYGERVQESVFELSLGRAGGMFDRLLDELTREVSDPGSVRFYRLTRDGVRDSWTLGGERIGIRPASIIIM